MIKINPIELKTGYRFKEFEENTTGNRIYLHGKIQAINGYDCCGILKDEFPTEEGIYPCEILGFPGKATLFLWKDKMMSKTYTEVPKEKEDYYFNGPGRFMGLVVLDSDELHYMDAKAKFENKVQYF